MEKFTQDELETIESMANIRLTEIAKSRRDAVLEGYIEHLEEKRIEYTNVLEKVRKM